LASSASFYGPWASVVHGLTHSTKWCCARLAWVCARQQVSQGRTWQLTGWDWTCNL